MKRIAVLFVALLLSLGGPVSSALAQNSPFAPLPPAPPEETVTPEPVDTNPADDEVSRETLAAILGAVVLLFIVIGYYITRDARRALPEGTRTDPVLREDAAHRKPKAAKAKSRQKARAAKKARKVTKRGR